MAGSGGRMLERQVKRERKLHFMLLFSLILRAGRYPGHRWSSARVCGGLSAGSLGSLCNRFTGRFSLAHVWMSAPVGFPRKVRWTRITYPDLIRGTEPDKPRWRELRVNEAAEKKDASWAEKKWQHCHNTAFLSRIQELSLVSIKKIHQAKPGRANAEIYTLRCLAASAGTAL